MKKSLLLLCFALTALQLCAARGFLVHNGKTNCRIVISQKKAEFIPLYRDCAQLLQKAFQSSAGVMLPIDTPDRGGYTLYIGTPSPGAAALQEGEYRVEARGKNLYIYGDDRKWKKKSSPADHRDYRVATAQAAAYLAEVCTEACWLYPGQSTPATEAKKDIPFPEGINYSCVPDFLYNFSYTRSGGKFYDWANGRMPFAHYGTYGGHSHVFAVRRNKYLKSNPEFFALHKNKRLHPALYSTQYCLSNPTVQELIFKEVVRKMDEGYPIVQLAQSDGFFWCECKKCAVLFNQKDSGEKLWILHRNIAEKVSKVRPGKKVCILAYGPTEMPPKSFKRFPDNVVIELAPPDKRLLDMWKSYHVPGGFVAYLYDFGHYHRSGLTPHRSFSEMAQELSAMRRAGVRGLYNCGYAEFPGLGGPGYFIWNQLAKGSTRSPGELLKFFCKKAFRSAAAEAEQFYTLLDSRIEKVKDSVEDVTNPGKVGNLNSRELLLRRFTPEVMQELDRLFLAIEKKEKSLTGSKLLAAEFTLLKLTMEALYLYDRFFKERTQKNFDAILAALEKRESFLNTLPWKGNYCAAIDGVPLFYGIPFKDIRVNGRLNAPVNVPLSWDHRWMKKYKVRTAGRIMKCNTPPQTLIQQNLYRFYPWNISRRTEVSCRMDSNNFYVKFAAPNEKSLNNNGFHVYLMRKNKGNFRVICGLTPKGNWSYLSKGTFDPKAQRIIFKRVPSPAFKANLLPGPRPAVEVVIPWKLVGGPPVPGEKCGFNALRNDKNANMTLVWEQTQSQPTYAHRLNEHGTVEF
ncbi:MAG: DUF4838 domain-containing protein [Lentisphaerae bacterium]|nr:DUF4838 domain-containing protein [Lentisphaerota bacterium]